MARAHLQEAHPSKRFWFWAVRTAFKRMNVLPMEIGKNADGTPVLESSFKLFHKRKPDMRTLFKFGSMGFFLCHRKIPGPDTTSNCPRKK